MNKNIDNSNDIATFEKSKKKISSSKFSEVFTKEYVIQQLNQGEKVKNLIEEGVPDFLIKQAQKAIKKEG